MIHLITGAVNQGKSTHLLGAYRMLQTGDGFYNRRIYRDDCLAGQEIVHLTTGESRLFSLREEFIPRQGNFAPELERLTPERERFIPDGERFTPDGERLTPEDWDEECRYDGFRFSRVGLNFGREIVRNALAQRLEPIFLDEIGPLELAGQGFCDLFGDLIIRPMEVYVVVRKSCLLEVIHKFSIMEFQIIQVVTR